MPETLALPGESFFLTLLERGRFELSDLELDGVEPGGSVPPGRLELPERFPSRRPRSGGAGHALAFGACIGECVQELERRVGRHELLLGALPLDRNQLFANPRECPHGGRLVLDERATPTVGGELAPYEKDVAVGRQARLAEDLPNGAVGVELPRDHEAVRSLPDEVGGSAASGEKR